MLPQEPFDYWNIIKKRLHFLPQEPFFQEGEIWWCSLGMNIGYEYNGKNINYERPVLIICKISNDMAWVLPISSQTKEHEFRFLIEEFHSQVIMSQPRTVSSRRLLRKIGPLSCDDFCSICDQIIKILHNTKLRHKAENLGGQRPAVG